MIYSITIVLVLLRVLPVVIVVPFLAGPSLSVFVRAGVAVAVSAIVLPAALATAPETFEGDLVVVWGLAVKELVVGCVIAVVTSLVFWGVEMAGSVAERLRGAPAGRPGVAGRTTALGTFGALLVVAMYFSVGGHLAFFAALVQSYAAVPLFTLPAQRPGGLLLESAVVAGEMFAVAALLALPVIAAVWLTDLALGAFERMTPRWHAMMVGLPARSLVVVVVFLMSLHVMVDVAVDGSLGWLDHLTQTLGERP